MRPAISEGGSRKLDCLEGEPSHKVHHQVILITEVIIEGSRGNIRFLADTPHRDTVRALFLDEGYGRSYDFFLIFFGIVL